MAGKYQEQKQHGREGTIARIAERNARKGQARAAVVSTPELAAAPNVVTSPSRPEPEAKPAATKAPGPGLAGLAEQWLALARDVLGRPAMVNRENFTKRLQEAISGDRFLRKVHQGPDGERRVNDLVSEMIIVFWQDVPADGGTQFAFLHDDWDYLVDRAYNRLRVKHLKAHGNPVERTEVHRDDNVFLATVRQQAEDEWMARALADEHAEPAPARGESDSLERFRK